jgi:nanoRNase/pAp phosphatase (c-di-AMP/oligoRNAs hydrolase)
MTMNRPPARREARRYITVRRQVDRLLRLLGEHKEAIILTHNDPDPDSIASSWALAWLLEGVAQVHCEILYGGIIGRAENRAMVDILRIPLKSTEPSALEVDKPVIMVDTQPGTGNNLLPPDAVPLAVIDHHPANPNTEQVSYRDLQTRLGATATIVTRYLWALDMEPPTALATALFYGIKTDTLGLSRAATRADALAYLYLHERADLSAIGAIERAHLPREYFAVMARALRNARVYGDVVISTLGEIQHTDMASEVADLLARLKDIRCVLCVGMYNSTLILSLRTTDPQLHAGQIIQKLVTGGGQAGGHNLLAGGRIPYTGSGRVAQRRIASQFIEILGLSAAQEERLTSCQ